MKKRPFLNWAGVGLIALAVSVVGCGDDDPVSPVAKNLVEVAEDAGSFNTLLTALDAAGLTSTLASGGPFTVFAPTDDAFAALPAGTLDALLADTDALSAVLLYHVTPGELSSTDLEGRSFVPTAQGQDVAVTTLTDIKVNGVPLAQENIKASNGVIHVIGEVLLPPSSDLLETAAAAGDFSTLLTAIEAAGLNTALQGDGPFTVFAPTNTAFAALPPGTLDALLADTEALTEVLLYHVVDEKLYAGDLRNTISAQTMSGFPILFPSFGAQVNNSLVGPANVLATNGVIHVIDTVLLPPANDIVEAASQAGLTTLVAAIEAAGLVSALQGTGPFTVFAPTNAAFEALPAGALDALLADADALADVLLFHVVDGQYFAGELDGVSSVNTLLGPSLPLDLSSGISVGGAMVTSADTITRNGVIHVIDRVLLPE